MAFLITHDEQMAEDAVQETFLRVTRQIRHFDEGRPFEPYLMRSVMHAAIDAAEKNAKWLPLEGGDNLEWVRAWIDCASRTEDEVEYNQLKTEIYQALAQLSPRQRTVIIQRYYQDMSEQEMAEILSIAPGTIKWLLHAARKRMRLLLSPNRSTK
jgi:RNA polymerase sigma-70 factor (ECF subfamily)